jgi:geranylgeranyl diphosphate synthase, type I
MSTLAGGSPVPASLTRHLDFIEESLREAIGADASELHAAARYALGWEDAQGNPAIPGGKRIRPALCLLGAEVCGQDAAVARAGAVAIELVHNFSLVHDDIEDRDRERHGRATLWARLGEAQAINAGDFLFTLAWQTLASDSSTAAERRVRAIQVLSAATAGMIHGQWADIRFETAGAVSIDDYLAMVSGKTGALLGASLEIGAVLAGAAPEISTSLGQWGGEVGLAFQAHDDILGIWGEPFLTGKSVTSDIARRKRSLPIVIGLGDNRARDVIAREFSPSRRTPDVEAVLEALNECGAREETAERGRRHAAAAEDLLESMSISRQHRDELAAVAEYVVTRHR